LDNGELDHEIFVEVYKRFRKEERMWWSNRCLMSFLTALPPRCGVAAGEGERRCPRALVTGS
jgi:hypothetical protein